MMKLNYVRRPDKMKRSSPDPKKTEAPAPDRPSLGGNPAAEMPPLRRLSENS